MGTIGSTPLVQVNVLRDTLPDIDVFAKLEYFNPGGSLKDRPVRQILLDALTNGALCPGKTILDSSSGNAGIAYAMLGAALGYPVALVVPENASLERRKRIVAHGANLITTDALKGYDEGAARGTPPGRGRAGALFLRRPVRQRQQLAGALPRHRPWKSWNRPAAN